jgi:hypothetical protein
VLANLPRSRYLLIKSYDIALRALFDEIVSYVKKKNKTEVKKTAIIKPKNFNQPSLVK